MFRVRFGTQRTLDLGKIQVHRETMQKKLKELKVIGIIFVLILSKNSSEEGLEKDKHNYDTGYKRL